jgi:serine/threonine protein kinase
MQEWKDAHPNVASVQGVVRDPVNHVPTYIIYEFATTSLERCLRESASPVTVTRWKRVWQQLFLGLAHLHNKSPPIVHGNIEPSMIMTREYQDGSVLLWLNAGLGEWKSLMTGATPPSSSFSHSAAENIRSKMKPDNATSIYVPPERALGDPAAIASPQGDVYAAAMVAAYLLVVFLPLKGSKQGLHTELLRPCDETLVRQEDTAYAATRWLRQHKGCEGLADILQLCTRKHPDERPTASDVCKALDLFDETSLLAADGGPTREEILVKWNHDRHWKDD